MKSFEILLSSFLTFNLFSFYSVHGSKAEKQLIQHLLNDLEPQERPVENHNDTVTVTIGLYILRIDEVVADMHHVDLTAWLNLGWQAHNLRWEPSEFENIDSLRLDPYKIWIPDIYSYTHIGIDKDPFHKTNVVVKNTGKVRYIPPAQITNPCHLNGSSYPFEKLRCAIKFGSWTWDGSHLEYNASSADINSIVQSPEWNVLECPAIRTEQYYSCCTAPYLDVQFVLLLQRRGQAILDEAKSFSYFALGLLFMSCLLAPSSAFTIILVLLSMLLSIHCSMRFDPKLGSTEPTDLAKYFVRLSYLGFLILFTNIISYHIYYKTGSLPLKVKQMLDKRPQVGSLRIRLSPENLSQSDIQHNYNDLQELTLADNRPKIYQQPRDFGEWQQFALLAHKFLFVIWTLVLIIFDFSAFPTYET
ncbi:acetylcholine receptor subunit alpha-type acr-16 isoform X2 [Folsomia candida]|uniref:acetylcholine receptor subunit alpha-type acr-16 isoform X2 n=1 Tax=Folsomia candida TaxID=158441 RepID=UPI001604D75B|nr:acetylcholine receptor subunit alpha-type acr-16 isoform X2 [Folsomia candida]